MPSYHYRALTKSGEVVSGSITAPSSAEVTRRIEFLGLLPIDSVAEHEDAPRPTGTSLFGRARAEDVTVFTSDLALLVKAGARIDDALSLLSGDIDIGRLRPVIAQVRAAVLSGESFGDAISRHPALFPPMYVALVRVGEASGTLEHILTALGTERMRAEALRRKVADALRYPIFVMIAATAVLIFFLLFVLPQFASVLRDFGAKLDPFVEAFLSLSNLVRTYSTEIGIAAIFILVALWLSLRRPQVRVRLLGSLSRLPGIRTILTFHRTALFCRNLGILLGNGVALTMTLRILVDMMSGTGNRAEWTKTAEAVRHGGKLSDALSDAAILPPVAIRMIKLGEETGQLPALAGRVADFYETKLQRSLDRVVGIVGPAAIIVISIVVGGLIVSVMTALLSITQIIG
jgi:general secretion pathway protein F